MKNNTIKSILSAVLVVAALVAGYVTAEAQPFSIRKTFFDGLTYSPAPESTDETYNYYAAGTVITLAPTNPNEIILTVSTPASTNPVIASDKRSATITMPAQNITSGSVNRAEVYKVILPEGITLGGSGTGAVVYTIEGDTYCKYDSASTQYYLKAPFGYSISSATYDGDEIILSNDKYTFTLKQKEASVTATTVDQFGIESGADGTEGHPYVITTTVGLNLVSSSSSYGTTNGIFFQLGADISYTPTGEANENNFDSINGFYGTFDGQGHVISGIRIYTSDSNRGLFSTLNGTVKNVVLSDARVRGTSNVGGIAGYILDGKVQDCLVLNSAITHTDNSATRGVIAGDYSGNANGCSNNLYNNCTINDSPGNGAYNSDRAWASNGYIVTLPDGVSAVSGNSLTHNGTTYHGSYSNTVTLTYDNLPAGKSALFTVTKTNDSSLVAETSGTFTMPKADVSVAVELRDNYSLTLPDGVSATGNAITIGNDTVYIGGTTVTLSYTGALDDGYEFVFSVNGSPILGLSFEITSNTVVTVATNDVWGITGGANGNEANPYVITSTAGLDLLSKKVNGIGGYNQKSFSGKYFILGTDIAYSHTTDWNNDASTEDNYTAIGGRIKTGGNSYSARSFAGSFDGQGHTVSGIRLYKNDNTYADDNQGLFGRLGNYGIVKNVSISDARIVGRDNVGGIVGYSDTNSTVENCYTTATVALHAVITKSRRHGGVVGYLDGGSIKGCFSEVTLTYANGLSSCTAYGGVVGQCDGNLQDCIAVGASIRGTGSVGAIVGTKGAYTFTNNYYKTCNVNGTANATNKGTADGDANGFCLARTITLDTHVGISGDKTVYNVSSITAVGSTVLSYYDGVSTILSSGEGQVVTLSQGDAPVGYGALIGYTVKDADDNDVTVDEDAGVYSFTMPAKDVTVTATWTPNAELGITATAATLFDEAKYVTTFYHGTLDYQLPEGAKAYTVNLEASKLVFHLIGNDGSVIPHGNAVVIVADAASITLTKLASTSVEPYAGNKLRGSDTDLAKPAGTVYVLGSAGEPAALGFYTFNGSTIPAHKAYYVVE